MTKLEEKLAAANADFKDTVEPVSTAKAAAEAEATAPAVEAKVKAAETKIKKVENEYERLFNAVMDGKDVGLYTVLPQEKVRGNHTVEDEILFVGKNSRGEPMALVRFKE